MRILAACLVLLALAGCASIPPGQQSLVLRPVAFAALPGWQDASPAGIVPGLRRDCERLALLPQDQRLGGTGLAATLAGQAGEWQAACVAARALPDGDDAATRRFLEQWFQPYAIADQASGEVRFTGYFEPEAAGALSPGDGYTVPVLALPGEPVAATRAETEHAPAGTYGRPLLWLRSPIDLFVMQVQGSGRVRLPDGSVVRLGYAGRNQQHYVPIGKVLVERGALSPDDVSLHSIRDWLQSHPAEAGAVMDANPEYVFFRRLPALNWNEGPPGALGVDLVPSRSVAVDRTDVPLASPVWVDTTLPDGRRLQTVMLAQDLGSNIKGPLREDVFFGWGPQAEWQAGYMNRTGRAYLLLLRPPPA